MLHALLGGTAVAIEIFDAWNDMNPTMLVWMAFHYIDYPLWMLVTTFAPVNSSAMAEIVFVAVVGTLAWFAVGLLIQFAFAR
jgi:hypothetical protein